MMIQLTFLTLFLGILVLFFIPKNNFKLLKIFSVFLSSFLLIENCLLFCFFDPLNSNFQLIVDIKELNSYILNIDFLFGLDGISLFFFFLTSFLTFLVILFIWDEKFLKSYLLTIFLLELLLLLTFSVLNIFLFYVFFEFILIPMYLMIGFWGSREKKIRAAYLLLFYTVCGSLLFLLSILYIYSVVGSFQFEKILIYKFTFEEQLILWIAFFFSFSSKIPMFPFHIWLPEAHVEAPTVGSVLLAGILLKLGVYGFIRYNLMFFPQASLYFSPLVFTLALIGIIFSSLTAIKQTDLKKIIAYSSIAHMNLIMLGIFSGNIIGIEAAILQSISHGFISSALFFLIGMLYARYHSRLIYYYSGITQIMPLYSFFMLFFTMSNIALPGTSSFIGEFLILNGLFQENFFCCFLAATSVVLGGIYSLWLYNRINFGNFKTEFLKTYLDLSLKEIFILSILLIVSLQLGLFPYLFLKYIHASVIKIFIVTNTLFL